MSPEEAKSELYRIFDGLGITPGQLLIVHSDMTGVPLPKNNTPFSRGAVRCQRETWCAFLFEALMARLGPEGTLAVPTFTYSTTKPGGIFHLEATPSEVGPFSEHVRRRPEARRSLHPIFSLAAVGRLAATIVDECGAAAFGQESPWQRLSNNGGRVVTLGTAFERSATYAHHMEHCFGSPHRFHKIVDIPVYREGERVEGYWLAYLRYLSIDVGPSLGRLAERLRREGVMRSVGWNGKISEAVDIADMDRIGYAMLRKDPWAFASRRANMHITENIPADGPCGSAEVDLRINVSASRIDNA
ncbi:MAG: AAC(3) family N-acetyltransferase [Alphaproteobacteria bacterium]